MQKRLKKERAHGRGAYGDLEVLFDRRVFDYVLEELSKNLSVEEGGKYIGYLVKPGDPLLEEVQSRVGSAIIIVDFLPSGPKAVRTSVELMPDGPYQEQLFREIEQLAPRIEHVGTWHSHHCNSLPTLSSGDVAGYFRTVNKPAYNLDFFVASLVKNVPERVETRGWIDHFLFVRGKTDYYQITDGIRIVDWPSAFGQITGHGAHVGEVRTPAALDLRPAIGLEQQSGTVWYETEQGRDVLATDKRFFQGTFGSVTATRRDSQITITARSGPRAVAVRYPRDASSQELQVLVKHSDSTLLRIECALEHRDLAYGAALKALEDL